MRWKHKPWVKILAVRVGFSLMFYMSTMRFKKNMNPHWKITVHPFWRTLHFPIGPTPAKTQNQLRISKPWADTHGWYITRLQRYCLLDSATVRVLTDDNLIWSKHKSWSKTSLLAIGFNPMFSMWTMRFKKKPWILGKKLPFTRFGEPFNSRLASLLPKLGINFEYLNHGLTPMADITRAFSAISY